MILVERIEAPLSEEERLLFKKENTGLQMRYTTDKSFYWEIKGPFSPKGEYDEGTFSVPKEDPLYPYFEQLYQSILLGIYLKAYPHPFRDALPWEDFETNLKDEAYRKNLFSYHQGLLQEEGITWESANGQDRVSLSLEQEQLTLTFRKRQEDRSSIISVGLSPNDDSYPLLSASFLLLLSSFQPQNTEPYQQLSMETYLAPKKKILF